MRKNYDGVRECILKPLPHQERQPNSCPSRDLNSCTTENENTCIKYTLRRFFVNFTGKKMYCHVTVS